MSMHEILEIQSIMDGIADSYRSERYLHDEVEAMLTEREGELVLSAPPNEEKEPEPWDI